MGEVQESAYWYRVAGLRPALRESVYIARQRYRGKIWYVLRNRLGGPSTRFNRAAFSLVGLMDGELTVQEIWDRAEAAMEETLPTQDSVIRLLAQLHEASLIQSDILPSTEALLRENHQASGGGLRQAFRNPLMVRIPLGNPDRLLNRWGGLLTPLLNPAVLILWMGVVATAVIVAAVHWQSLVSGLNNQLLQPRNLLLIWFSYPVMKLLHELGHALAVKRWGGEIHEMGVVLLALTPIPYVDASASAAFPAKGQRICVAAMGMMVELFIASLALFLWLNVQPGLVSALAYNLMLIGGISTLLFNGNPLLRYDGYYILSDLVEIPNLAQRSGRYFSYLLQRYLLDMDTAESPVTAAGERGWFLVYGPVAFCYRILVLTGVIWMISGRFFIIGILLALWGLVTLLLRPALTSITRLMQSAAHRRGRLAILGGGSLTAVGLLIFTLPIPFWTAAQGVVWLPEHAHVRAGATGEVVALLAHHNQVVTAGTPILCARDPLLEASRDLHRARLDELYTRYHALPLKEQVKRRVLMEEIRRVRGDLDQSEEKMLKLVVSSPTSGRLVLPKENHLPGRFIREGDILGYIVDAGQSGASATEDLHPTIRAVVSQTDIALINERLTGVEVRLAQRVNLPFEARIERILPAADLILPSAALGTAGGGPIAVDPSDPQGRRALETHFQLDLGLPAELHTDHFGGRVYVRFEHGRLPLGWQWYRSIRQLLLRRFYA
jgi:putative peptide zinc metalloprotease protein